MPLLQEAHVKTELGVLRSVKGEADEVTTLGSPLNRVGFPLPNTSMFTPSQFLVASQTAALMAASGLGLPGANPAFFHPGLFASAWNALSPRQPNSPPSPALSGGQLSPLIRGGEQLSPLTAASRKHNNNNVVSSSSGELVKQPKRKYRKIKEEVPLSPPNSGSPPSSGGEAPVPGVIIKEGPRDKQFTCGICNRSFGYKHVLQNHERTHTGEKPFECPECHKRFTRDHHLKTHMRLHTGERPYHCDFCDRQFVQVANLRRHLRVHTGERPYACQYCTARFSDSNQLKAHVLIHKGEKPFQCPSCSGKFRRRHHLLHHKCGGKGTTVPDTSSPPGSDLSDDFDDRGQALLRPFDMTLPEQTEPEDLSMSTGLHSHSSESPRSRSPLSHDEDDLDDAVALWQRQKPS